MHVLFRLAVKRMKILIVDDHEDMRKVIRSVIAEGTASEIDFLECNEADKVRHLYQVHHPDFVLMDIQLGVDNGLSLSESLLKIYPEARIIFVTGFDTPAFRTRATRMGAAGFISKDNLSEVSAFLQI